MRFSAGPLLLYKCRDQLEPIEDLQKPPANSREGELRLVTP